ncbi:MAG: histidine kinase dimerization/phospho-acceptor domain-containing protein [Lysobacteraceae bacterium]
MSLRDTASSDQAPAPGEWLSRLAHDLRGPLTPMQMAVQMLQAPDVPAQRVRTLANTIDRQINLLLRMAHALDDMLIIGRGAFFLQLASYDLRTIIDSAVTIASRHTHNLGREMMPVVIRAPAAPVRVRADDGRLSQLLALLLADVPPDAWSDQGCWIGYESVGDHAVVRLHDDARRIYRSASVDYLSTGVAPIDPGMLGMFSIIGRAIAVAHGASLAVGDEDECGIGELTLRLPLAIATESTS